MGTVILLSVMGVFMILPLVLVISNAFKPLDEMFVYPPRFLVRNPTFDNFKDLLILMSNSWVPFSRYIFNTLLITAIGTAGQVIIGSLAAYALAKFKFPGSRFIATTIVLSLMFSGVVTAIPNYLMMAKLGFIDTYAAVIVPTFASSLGLYLMMNYMSIIPDSLLESARIDGAKELRIFWKIAMPAVKPAWLTLIILSVQGLWNMTSAFTYSEELKTLTTALGQVLAGGIARAGAGSAVGLFMLIVPITVFIVNQAHVIETMSTSGMKD